MRNTRAIVVITSLSLLAAITLTGLYIQGNSSKEKEYVDLTEIESTPKIEVAKTETEKEDTVKADTVKKEEKKETSGTGAVAKNFNEKEIPLDNAMDASEQGKDESIVLPQKVEKIGNLTFNNECSLDWPVEGKVLLNYSMDQTVYFPTLEQYKYNPAVLISSEVNTPVLSAYRGKVVNIENSEETGTTMTVDLGNGYQLRYGQLKEIPLSKGNIVEKGEVLGYVSETTKYYSVEGCNLYFEMTLDDAPINPFDFMDVTEAE